MMLISILAVGLYNALVNAMLCYYKAKGLHESADTNKHGLLYSSLLLQLISYTATCVPKFSVQIAIYLR